MHHSLQQNGGHSFKKAPLRRKLRASAADGSSLVLLDVQLPQRRAGDRPPHPNCWTHEAAGGRPVSAALEQCVLPGAAGSRVLRVLFASSPSACRTVPASWVGGVSLLCARSIHNLQGARPTLRQPAGCLVLAFHALRGRHRSRTAGRDGRLAGAAETAGHCPVPFLCLGGVPREKATVATIDVGVGNEAAGLLVASNLQAQRVMQANHTARAVSLLAPITAKAYQRVRVDFKQHAAVHQLEPHSISCTALACLPELVMHSHVPQACFPRCDLLRRSERCWSRSSTRSWTHFATHRKTSSSEDTCTTEDVNAQ